MARSSLIVRRTGPWSTVQLKLNTLPQDLYPSIIATFNELGDLIVNKIQGHIDSQDLGWTPLSSVTIELKGGDSTIYVDSGTLRNSITALKVKDTGKTYTLYIGIPQGGISMSGYPLSDLLIWMEYGTDRMPARPLIEPSWDEVRPIVEAAVNSTLERVLRK